MEDILAVATTMLSATPQRWTSLAATTPEALLERAPASGEWSAKACLGHLLDAERFVFPRRVRAFLAGRDLQNFDPDSESTSPAHRTTAAMAAEFARLRAASIAELAGVKDADLARTARHSALGEVTLTELIHEWVAHDLNHTVQAERAMMQPFIAACGSWRGFFADHIAKSPTPEA
ncbi:MAG TPA: DinB family protein [Ktedonobacterales bacterium]|nr:DinB family protein [Ktedonobacterales bacterium]